MIEWNNKRLKNPITPTYAENVRIPSEKFLLEILLEIQLGIPSLAIEHESAIIFPDRYCEGIQSCTKPDARVSIGGDPTSGVFFEAKSKGKAIKQHRTAIEGLPPGMGYVVLDIPQMEKIRQIEDFDLRGEAIFGSAWADISCYRD
jgi:hypothetical protein